MVSRSRTEGVDRTNAIAVSTAVERLEMATRAPVGYHDDLIPAGDASSDRTSQNWSFFGASHHGRAFVENAPHSM